MIICADLGNSRIKFAFFERGVKTCLFSVSAKTDRTADEWRLLLLSFCREKGICPENAEGAALSSVAPAKTPALTEALTALIGKKPLTVGPGIRTGLDIRTDYQVELGADIVAAAVGAKAEGKLPFIVADLGTALTLFAVDEKASFLGVAIAPGVSSAKSAMAKDCAGLYEIEEKAPKSLLGKNTADSVAAGLFYGYAALLDGLTEQVAKEYSLQNAALYLTGGDAEKVLPYCKTPFEKKEDLTLEGLARLFEANRPARHA